MASPSRSALVVGDSALLRTYVTAILRSAGFLCVEAANGFLAMDRLSERSFDLCVVDLDMPQANGMTIFALTLVGGYRKLRPAVIGVSGRPDAQHGVWTDEQALSAVLGKPFRPDELVGILRSIFDAEAAE